MKTKRIAIMMLCLFMCVIMGGENLLSAFFIPASAADESEVEYTNAYNDLISNKSFNPDDYPQLQSSDPDYYKLEVITIAESENNELFVYVYQPSGQAGDLRAVSIDISTKERTDKQFTNYKLTYLNSYGQFYKYKVDDLYVVSDYLPTRYYEISDILRPWSESYGDKKPGGDNTISEVAYPVGKLFTFTGTSSMTVEDIEYITITDKYVGFVRYEQDSWFLNYSMDAHFVAFSTDRRIDELLEADVYYVKQDYLKVITNGVPGGEPWEEKQECYRYLHDQSFIEIELSDGSTLTHSFKLVDEIQKTSEFLTQSVPLYIFPGFSIPDHIEFSEEALLNLAQTDWVLTFDVTPYFLNFDGTNFMELFTRVGDVKILRLKFKTDGVTYNLGVVDNKQTGSKDPAAVVEEQDWWQKIMMILMLILIIVIASFFWDPLASVLKILWFGIKTVFKILVWILSRPWAIFRWLLGFLQKDKKQKPGGK